MATRLLIAFVVLILPLVVLSIWSFRRSLNEERRSSLTEAVQSAQTAAVIVHGLLRDLDGTTLAMARALGAQPGPLTQDSAGPYLAVVSQRYPFVRNFFVVSPDGHAVVTLLPELAGRDLSARPYIQALRGGQEFYLSDLTQSILTGEPQITVARTIRAPDGTLRGYLAAVFYPVRLVDIFPQSVPQDARLAVYDRSGQLIYRSPETDIPWDARAPTGPAASYVQSALAGRVVDVRHLRPSPDGRDELGAFVPVPDYGWAVGVTRSIATAEQPLQDLYRHEILILAAVTIAALLVGAGLSHTLVRPLAQLARQAREFGHGDRATVIARGGPVEVQTLASALNGMAAEVQARFAERLQAEEALRRSEARFRSLVQHASDVIAVLGADGVLHYVGSSVQNVLGYPPGALEGTSGFAWLHPDDLAAAQTALAGIAAEPGAHASLVVRARHQDGSWRWVDLVLTNLLDEPSVGGIVANARDITERRLTQTRQEFLGRAGALLTESLDYETTLERLARLAVPFLADWCTVHVVDPDGGLRRSALAHVDPDKATLLEEMRRRYPLDPTGNHPVARAVRTGQPVLVPEASDELFESYAHDDEHLAMLRRLIGSFLAVPLIGRGRPLGAIAFATFESGRRYDHDDLALAVELARRAALAVDNARLYRETQVALRDTESALAVRDEFLSVASHELRTPLTALKAYLELVARRVERAGTSEEIGDLLAAVRRQADRLRDLVNDLLDVSRIAGGRLTMAQEPVDAGSLVRRVVALEREAVASGHAVLLDVDGPLPVVVGDTGRLEQVLLNLLDNARKYSPPDAPITVRAGVAGDDLVIAVRDEGIGIPPQEQEHIFDRFWRAGNVDKGVSGLGLGLYIAHSIVEAHGGTLTVASAPGAGSTFTMRLPCHAAGRPIPEPAAARE